MCFVDVPVQDAYQAKVKLQMIGKKTKPSGKASDSYLVYSLQLRPPTGGIFALAPSLAPLNPMIHIEGATISLVANMFPVCQVLENCACCVTCFSQSMMSFSLIAGLPSNFKPLVELQFVL
jgi:hypothetical protein